MAQLLKLEAVGYRDVMGRFAKRTDELQRAKREEMRGQGRAMVKTLQQYAPEDTGVFKRGIAYRTDERGDVTTVTIYVRGEHAFLLPMLTGGTEPHLIFPRGDYPLRFFWSRGPEGPKEYRYRYVEHPGTMPDPFVSYAVDAMSPQFEMGLERVARRVAWL